MRRPAAVLIVLALLFAGACSSDSNDAKDPVDANGSTTDPGSDATDTTATTVKAAKGATTEAQLEAKLLTLKDLPSGWKVDPSAADDSSDDSTSSDDSSEPTPECMKDVEDDDGSTATAEADFLKGEDFPSLAESLDVYPVDKIAGEFDTASEVLDKCGTFDLTSDDVQMTGSITRLASFPKFGDRSGAWQMRMSSMGITFDFTMVFVQKGDVALSIFYGILGEGAAEQVLPYVQKAVAKL